MMPRITNKRKNFMINTTLVISAFITGLLGNLHCFGMCGGLSSALSLSLKEHSHYSSKKIFAYQLIYNFGRLSTYICFGLLAGTLGQVISTSFGSWGDHFLRIISGLLIVSLGFYLTNWWRGLSKLETKGAKLWQKIAPLMNRLMPVKTLKSAYALGLLWGFLPCGLIYSTLTLAASSGSTINGAFIMLSFGIGTLPSMLLTGLIAQKLSKFIRLEKVQLLSGIMIICFGIWTIIGPYLPHHMLMLSNNQNMHHCH